MSFSLLVDPLGSCLAPVNNLPPMLRQETLLRFSASHTGRHENRTGTHCKGGGGDTRWEMEAERMTQVHYTNV